VNKWQKKKKHKFEEPSVNIWFSKKEKKRKKLHTNKFNSDIQYNYKLL